MKDENRTKAELIAELQSLRSIVDRSSDGIALPQSTDLFRLAFRTSPDGFMISRLDDWLVIDVNDAFCEITGFSRAEVTGAVGNEVNIWASPEDRARFIGELTECGEVQAMEAEFRMKDGSLVSGLISARVLDLDGVPHVLSVAKKIDELKETERTLQRTNRLLKTVFDNTHILLAYLDTRFNFIEVNSAYAEADNRSPEFFPGKNHFDLYPNSENQRIYEEVLRSGKPHNETGKAFEYVHNPERGESHWDWSLVPVKTDRGQVEGLVLALLNVTERVKAETARLESAALFRTMFESSSVGISKVSLDFVIEEINQAHCSMLGYTCDELVGMTIWDITDPVSLPEGKRMQARLRRGEIDSYQMEKKYVRRDGKAVWGLLDANLVRDSNGDPLYFLGNIVDITEKKDLELQLLQSQRLEAIGQLAGGVAHDFNNLLTVINGYSALVLDKLSDGDPKRLDIEQIATAGEKAGMLTRQLLAFSRKQVIRPTIVDLNAVVADMTTMLRRLVGENIVVRTILAEGLGKTRVDPGQMNQIIMNLAVNARDAMPTGGQITVETANFEIDREYSARHMSARHGAYCLMSISDDGIGMDEGTRSHAFEPFFTTKGVGEGTGLGLPTVYGIVKQHNGYIWLYSEPGHGTTVKVYLPQVEVNSGQPVGQCTNNGAPSGTETILLAEDDDIVRKLTASILEQSGYTVLQAADGHLALDVFGDESGRIDLLLTDVIMPGMGGKELADQLLAQSPDLRVIFVSGYTDEAISRIGILPGDVELLSKPFHPKALLTLVRDVLDREN